MTRIFISYSRQDEKFVLRLTTDLEKFGAHLWLDTKDIVSGKKWSSAIQEGLRECELMLLILSPDSMTSTNVEDEWQYFHTRNKPIIPILLRPTEVHFQIERINYVNFSENAYEDALAILIRELQQKGVHLQNGLLEPIIDDTANLVSPQNRHRFLVGSLLAIVVLMIGGLMIALLNGSGIPTLQLPTDDLTATFQIALRASQTSSTQPTRMDSVNSTNVSTKLSSPTSSISTSTFTASSALTPSYSMTPTPEQISFLDQIATNSVPTPRASDTSTPDPINIQVLNALGKLDANSQIDFRIVAEYLNGDVNEIRGKISFYTNATSIMFFDARRNYTTELLIYSVSPDLTLEQAFYVRSGEVATWNKFYLSDFQCIANDDPFTKVMLTKVVVAMGFMALLGRVNWNLVFSTFNTATIISPLFYQANSLDIARAIDDKPIDCPSTNSASSTSMATVHPDYAETATVAIRDMSWLSIEKSEESPKYAIDLEKLSKNYDISELLLWIMGGFNGSTASAEQVINSFKDAQLKATIKFDNTYSKITAIQGNLIFDFDSSLDLSRFVLLYKVDYELNFSQEPIGALETPEDVIAMRVKRKQVER